MKKTTALYAVTAMAVIAFSGIASARGGNGGGGRGAGCANCPNQASMSGPRCDGTGLGQQQTGTRMQPMDGTGNRYGQTGGNAGMTTAPPDTGTTQASSTAATN